MIKIFTKGITISVFVIIVSTPLYSVIYSAPAPNEIDKSDNTIVFENPITFHLVGNEKVRVCPSFTCGIAQWGTYNGDATITKKQGEWYFVHVVDKGKYYNEEYLQGFYTSGSVDGWIYYTLIPESILPQIGGISLIKKDEVIGTGTLKNQSSVLSCPSTSCTLLTYLDAGIVLQIFQIDQTGEWYEVKLNDPVLGQYLEGWDKWIKASNFTDESHSLISGSSGKVSTSTTTSTQQKPFFSFPAFGNWIKSVADRFGSGFAKGFLSALVLLIILAVFYLIGKYRLISRIDFSWLKHHRIVGIALSFVCVIAVFFLVFNYYQKREDELKSFITAQQRTIEATQKSVEGLSEKAEEESQQRIAQERAAREIVQRLETKIASASTNKTTDLVSVVNQWSSIIAKIECDFIYSRQQFVSFGSGTALSFNGQVVILSNRHVLVPEDVIPISCRTKIPGSASTYSGDDIRVAVSGEDWAVFYPNNADSQIRNITATQPAMCTRKPSVGDSIVILGYPSIGSKTSITATEGIIAGYDDNYFITSAKVEQGNSGGAAILVKDNCLLGIPTFAQVGKVESLARILDISTVFR